ncbi:MAG: hypothetical protein WC860_05720 [Candidatus Margulisiibacteriota bacterium]|jgi:hypothetical protein
MISIKFLNILCKINFSHLKIILIIFFCLLNSSKIQAKIDFSLSTNSLILNDIFKYDNGQSGWYFLYSKKNQTLNNSLFLKWQTKNNMKVSRIENYYAEYAIAGFYMPEAMVNINTLYDRKTSYLNLGLRTLQQYQNKNFFINNLSTIINFRTNAWLDKPYGNLGYIQGDYNLTYTQNFSNFNLALSWQDLFRTSAYLPLSVIRNSYVNFAFKHDFFTLNYFYPIILQLLQTNYPFQKERIELNLNNSIASFPLFLNIIYQMDYRNATWLMLKSYQKFNDAYFAPYLTYGGSDNQLLIGVSISEIKPEKAINFQEYSFNNYVDSIPQVKYTQSQGNLPNEIQNYSYDDLRAAINTPEAAEEYTEKYINFAADHRDFSGLFTIYSPEYVFKNKRGNCLEQSLFQAALLHGKVNDLRIVACSNSDYAHTILFYQEKNSNLWKAMDNTTKRIYLEQAKTIEELENKIYPGWYTLVVKDEKGSNLYQVNSETNWYINDWFTQ